MPGGGGGRGELAPALPPFALFFLGARGAFLLLPGEADLLQSLANYKLVIALRRQKSFDFVQRARLRFGLGVAGLAEPLQLPVSQGVLIDTVVPDSPASKAGLHGGNTSRTVREQSVCVGGDIIVAIDGLYIANMDELTSYLVVSTAPGDTVNLLIVRGEDTFEVPVALEARPSEGTIASFGCG